jgi:transposase
MPRTRSEDKWFREHIIDSKVSWDEVCRVQDQRTRFQVNWEINNINVKDDACSNGMFPLITNCEDISLKDILEIYKYQPNLEKRHEQVKTIYGIAPVLLKNITRVEALLFVFFVALLVKSVIEREMRSNMKKAGLKSIPIYHEKRQCASPTTDKVLDLFNNIQRHHLTDNGVFVKTFNPKLNDVQTLVLDILDIP